MIGQICTGPIAISVPFIYDNIINLVQAFRIDYNECFKFQIGCYERLIELSMESWKTVASCDFLDRFDEFDGDNYGISCAF